MKKLLIITQRVDVSDDLLGFFVGWLREFSDHFNSVSVITLAKGVYDLPENVHVYSLGKEHGIPKGKRYLRFFHLLRELVPQHHSVFAHMSPIFAVAAWPFTAVWRKRLVLWYLHRSKTLRLRLALAMCDALVTADTASLTITGPKIHAVGHGIAVDRFHVDRDWSGIHNRSLRIISVGRLAPIKDFETLIRATDILRDQGRQVEVRIVGRALTKAHREEERQLRKLVKELNLSGSITFSGLVPYRDMPAQYAWADAVVGCTPKGGLDKAVLEGMAAGCVPFTSNEAMRPYIAADAVFPHGDYQALAEAIHAIEHWAQRSESAVQAVREHHALPRAIARISNFL